MQNGITYMVRPRMQPSKISANVWRISAGAIQLLVGPASSSASEQMNVRSSTRATSPGSEAHQKLFGRSFGFSRVKVPCSTSKLVSLSHSSFEPSHQTTSSGLVSSAMPCTQLASSGRLVSAGSSIRSALNIAISLHKPTSTAAHRVRSQDLAPPPPRPAQSHHRRPGPAGPGPTVPYPRDLGRPHQLLHAGGRHTVARYAGSRGPRGLMGSGHPERGGAAGRSVPGTGPRSAARRPSCSGLPRPVSAVWR